VKERNPGVRDKIIAKSTENLLHQKRERCKGNRQKERGAKATDRRREMQWQQTTERKGEE
jgi:hypothetical protein